MPSLLPGESDANPASTLIAQTAITAFLLAPLHSGTLGDLVMWTECELIQWIDAAVKKLARTAGIFAGRSLDTVTAQGTATYALPAQHISTLHASYDARPLRPASTGELAARDSKWQTRQDSPQRWYQDAIGLGLIGLAPVPDDAQPLWIIYHGWPQTVDCAGANTTVPLLACLEPYIELEVIAAAYTKEGDGYAPDIAQAARSLAGIYEGAARAYWGPVG